MKYLFFLLLLLPNISQGAVKIATGSAGGTYYQMAKDVAVLAAKEGIEVIVLATGGSVENLSLLDPNLPVEQRVAMAFVQEDILDWSKSTNSGLKRAANLKKFPILTEEIHLLVPKGFVYLKDLKGKKVALGSNGSGTSFTASGILRKFNVQTGVRLTMPYEKALMRLKSGAISGVFFVGGAPVKTLSSLAPEYGGKFTLLTMTGSHKPYKKVVIPKGTYSWQDEDVTTLAVQSYLVFSLEENCEERLKLFRIAKENLELLKKTGHPKWKAVKIEQFKGMKGITCP
ncbi:MAG: TAXI family TRAP transporter solute-binding subunit [SAR324 cluster bacterium]|nr:TAXI family TRAP transporter solute-binding subunit [SAR324 cluster bacterium]